MNWATVFTLVIGAAMGAIPSIGLAVLNNRAAAQREQAAFVRESRERRRHQIAVFFSEAFAIALLMRQQREAGEQETQQLQERRLMMLAQLRLQAGDEIAQQWGAFAGATTNAGQSPIAEQKKLEQMMRDRLNSIAPLA